MPEGVRGPPVHKFVKQAACPKPPPLPRLATLGPSFGSHSLIRASKSILFLHYTAYNPRSGKLDRLPEEVEEGYLGEGARRGLRALAEHWQSTGAIWHIRHHCRARVAWMDPSDRNSLQDALCCLCLPLVRRKAGKLLLALEIAS